MALVEGAVIIWGDDFGRFRDLLTPAVDGTRWEDCLPGDEVVNANREKYAGRLARFLLLDVGDFVTRPVAFVLGDEGLARRVDPLWFVPSDNSSSAPEEGGVGGRGRGTRWGTPTDERTGEDAPESEVRARRGWGMVECQLVLEGLRA